MYTDVDMERETWRERLRERETESAGEREGRFEVQSSGRMYSIPKDAYMYAVVDSLRE